MVVSKGQFGCLAAFLQILFFSMAMSAAIWVKSVWRVEFPPGVVCGGAILYTILANVTADRIFKRFGLSRSGTVVEVRARSPWVPDDDMPVGDFAEARYTRGMIRWILIVLPAFGLLFLAAPLVVDGFWRQWSCRAMGAFLLVGFVHSLWDRKNPQARADAEGITGYPSHRAIRRVFVPWSDVQTCEIRTIYNTFGQPIVLIPILRGHNGETLMALNLMYTPMAEQERIAKFIRSRLPDKQVDPWDV